jgi:hypothetical protein
MTKSIFTSKTLAAQTVTAAAALYPPARELVALYPGEALVVLAMVNAALRWITKGRLTIFA